MTKRRNTTNEGVGDLQDYTNALQGQLTFVENDGRKTIHVTLMERIRG